MTALMILVPLGLICFYALLAWGVVEVWERWSGTAFNARRWMNWWVFFFCLFQGLTALAALVLTNL